MIKRIGHFFNGWGGLAVWLALVGILAFYPSTSPKGVALLTGAQIFILVTLASNWNLIGGMTGYVDFGHAVFFGIGAYVMGILVTRIDGYIQFAPHLGFWQAIPFAGIIAPSLNAHRSAHPAAERPLLFHCHARHVCCHA